MPHFHTYDKIREGDFLDLNAHARNGECPFPIEMEFSDHSRRVGQLLSRIGSADQPFLLRLKDHKTMSDLQKDRQGGHAVEISG